LAVLDACSVSGRFASSERHVCGAQQLHAGVEQAFAAAKKAHPALRLANAGDVRGMAARLEGMGYAVRWAGDAPGVVRFHVRSR
jgi:hypothetical protein